MQVPALNVAFPRSFPSSAYEPTKIYKAFEYIFLENIYSTLVEYKSNGEIAPGVAESFEWIGNDAVLTIRNGLTTVNGIKITAEDVEFSLKRLLVLSSNTHGNFNDLVCPGLKLEKVTDPCPGIVREGSKIILRPGKRTPFLFPMLTALDFAIIPKSSVDASLTIQDYGNTSGPFYVKSDDGHGHIVLAANPSHYHYHVAMPQVVSLIPAEQTPSLKLFSQGKVDLITTIDASGSHELLDFVTTQKDAVLHQTMNIKTFAANFSPRGLSRTTPEQRLAFAKKLRRAVAPFVTQHTGMEPTAQFFPVFSEGGLTPEQVSSLDKRMASVVEDASPQDLTISVRGANAAMTEPYIKKVFGNTIVDNKRSKFTKEDLVDVAVISTDTGFSEDIGLVSYSVNFGTLGRTPEEGRRWLATYMQTEDKAERLAALRKLHFEALESGQTIPLAHAPYVAIARKPWTHGLSRFYANNPFYFMRYEPN